VVLEPLTRNESNLVNNLGSLKRMLDEIQSPKLAAMADTIPMALAGENFTDYIGHLGDDFVHVHFIDGPDGHLAWGDGNLPLDQYIEQLVRGNYAGSLTLEFTSSQYVKDPDLAIEKTLDRLSPFLA
jgi:fructoselysine 3-epimerase